MARGAQDAAEVRGVKFPGPPFSVDEFKSPFHCLVRNALNEMESPAIETRLRQKVNVFFFAWLHPMDGNERLGEMDEERRRGHCGTRKSNKSLY